MTPPSPTVLLFFSDQILVRECIHRRRDQTGVPHVPHVRKSGLKVPDLENHSKKCENGPKRAENDADDVAGASEAAVELLDVLQGADDAQGPAQTHADVVDDVLAADTGPMSLRKVRKVVLPSFENSKTNHN